MYPRLFELGPITLYTYGVLLAAAYLLGLKLAMVRAEARGLDQTRMLELGIYIIISALTRAVRPAEDRRAGAQPDRAVRTGAGQGRAHRVHRASAWREAHGRTAHRRRTGR